MSHDLYPENSEIEKLLCRIKQTSDLNTTNNDRLNNTVDTGTN